MKTIGLLGGMSWGSTASYYKLIEVICGSFLMLNGLRAFKRFDV